MEQARLLDKLRTIDVGFDFTTDTGGYWEIHEGTDLNICPTDAPDPDTRSRTLREYHRILWSRELPNGETMRLENALRFQDYLVWDGHRFGSDSIVQTYRRNSMGAISS